jgi:hypothetical protein
MQADLQQLHGGECGRDSGQPPDAVSAGKAPPRRAMLSRLSTGLTSPLGVRDLHLIALHGTQGCRTAAIPAHAASGCDPDRTVRHVQGRYRRASHPTSQTPFRPPRQPQGAVPPGLRSEDDEARRKAAP